MLILWFAKNHECGCYWDANNIQEKRQELPRITLSFLFWFNVPLRPQNPLFSLPKVGTFGAVFSTSSLKTIKFFSNP